MPKKEPLKGKWRKILDLGKWYSEEDVKSAVQGLLEEIEEYFKSQIDKENDEHICFC